jgi:hypothetical protein
MTYRRWTDLTQECLQALVDEYGTLQAVSDHLGVTRPALSQTMRRLGITIQYDRSRRQPSGHFSDLHQYAPLLRHLASIGWTCQRIRDALELQVEPEAVRRWLRANDIAANAPDTVYTGEWNHCWVDGRTKQKDLRERYITIPRPPDYVGLETSNGWVFEHRVIAQRKLGRPLLPEEEVHHIDEDGKNNAPENLLVFPNHEAHMRYHYEQWRVAAEARLAELRELDRVYVHNLGW